MKPIPMEDNNRGESGMKTEGEMGVMGYKPRKPRNAYSHQKLKETKRDSPQEHPDGVWS